MAAAKMDPGAGPRDHAAPGCEVVETSRASSIANTTHHSQYNPQVARWRNHLSCSRPWRFRKMIYGWVQIYIYIIWHWFHGSPSWWGFLTWFRNCIKPSRFFHLKVVMFPRSRSEWTVCDFFSAYRPSNLAMAHRLATIQRQAGCFWRQKKGQQKTTTCQAQTWKLEFFFSLLEKSHVLWPPWHPGLKHRNTNLHLGHRSWRAMRPSVVECCPPWVSREAPRMRSLRSVCRTLKTAGELVHSKKWLGFLVVWWVESESGGVFFCFFLRSVSFQFVGCVFFLGEVVLIVFRGVKNWLLRKNTKINVSPCGKWICWKSQVTKLICLKIQ